MQSERPAVISEQGPLAAAREALAATRFDDCIDLARQVFCGARESRAWQLAGDAETECSAWVMLATEDARQETSGPAQQALDEAARLHRVEGCLHACESQLPQALAAYGTLAGMSAKLPPALACSAWIERGLVQRRLGLHDEAQASGERAAACNPAPQPQRTVDIRRLALITDLQGQPQQALELMRSYHARRQCLSMAAMDTRVAALSVSAEGQGLRIENRSLREQNASLTASVQQVSHQAATDPLTGLLNRRGFDAAWSLSAHGGRRRMLLLAALDHVKQINDGYPLAVGDTVLRRIAALMQQTLRGHDRLVRHGGEEFVALLLDIDPAAARTAVERLCNAIRAFDWSGVSPGLSVTVSGGLVEVGTDEGLERTLERADKLLYAAKAAGRNQVLDETSSA